MQILLALRMTLTFSGKMITCNFDELYQTYIRGLEHLYGRLHSHTLCFGDYLTSKSQRSTHARLRGYLILLRHRTPVYSIHWQTLRVIRPSRTEQTTKVCYLRPHSGIEPPDASATVRGHHRDNLHQIGGSR